MSENEKPIWERLKGESGRSYHAFTVYRNFGLTRSLTKAAEQLQKQNEERLKRLQKISLKYPQNSTKTAPKLTSIVRRLKDWSAKHNWTARVEAWDAEQDRITILELQQAQKEAAKRHVDLGRILQAKGAIRLKQLNPEINPEDLSPAVAMKYIETGVRIERQILGEPDQVVKHTGSLQVQSEWVTRMEAEQRQASEELAPTNDKQEQATAPTLSENKKCSK